MGFTVCANWKESKQCRECLNSIGKPSCWEQKTLETQEDVDAFYKYGIID